MKIYVAASSKELARAIRIMNALRERGHEITYDWTVPMRELGPDAGLTFEQRGLYAAKPSKGIEEADVFWQLIPTTPSSGAWWELGYACGLRNGGGKHPLVVVSGDANRCIFTALVPFYFALDAQALAYVLGLTAPALARASS